MILTVTEAEQGATRFAVFIDFSQGLCFVHNPPSPKVQNEDPFEIALKS